MPLLSISRVRTAICHRPFPRCSFRSASPFFWPCPFALLPNSALSLIPQGYRSPSVAPVLRDRKLKKKTRDRGKEGQGDQIREHSTREYGLGAPFPLSPIRTASADRAGHLAHHHLSNSPPPAYSPPRTNVSAGKRDVYQIASGVYSCGNSPSSILRRATSYPYLAMSSRANP
jgi:hypothetical protein